jgi:hypothetical protein
VGAGVRQWPLSTSQTRPAGQAPAAAQPGTHCPPEQMLAGAPGHSASPLHERVGGGGSGQPATPGRQQWPVSGSQTSPSTQTGLTVQPGWQLWSAVRQTRSGGSQPSSVLHEEPMAPPAHSPVAATHSEPPTQSAGSARHERTQRRSAEQMLAGGLQSRAVAQPRLATMSLRLQAVVASARIRVSAAMAEGRRMARL